MMAKLNFQQPLLQISLSHDPSEIILTCWMGKQETFLITIFDEEQFKRTESFKNKNLPVYYETLKYTKSLHCLARLTKHWQTYITVTHRLCLKDPSNTSIELNCIAPKVLQSSLQSSLKRPWLFWCESKSDCGLMIVDIAYTTWTKGENTPGSAQSLTSLETVL